MITVQFLNGQEGRISETYGPYEYVEMTYNALYSEEKQREIAFLNGDGVWETEDGLVWSDFTVS